MILLSTMKKPDYLKALLTLTAILVSFLSYSQDIPVPNRPEPPRLVNDIAGVLSSEEVEALENKLVSFSDTTSNQIVFVSLSDLKGYQPYEVAYQIGDDWGVGQKEFDNGIVILFKPKTSTSKGEIFIATGSGLEGAIPDGTAKMIVEREMIPQFKNGNIYRGIDAGSTVLMALASGEYSTDEYASKRGAGAGSFVPFIFFFFLILFFIIRRLVRAREYGVGHDVPFWTALMLANSTRGHSGSWGSFSSGSSGFGGGGFGGFGGGGFGGGGAGGSW